MREQIKKIVFEEFSRLTDLIEGDFAGNYRRKVNNFLLSQMDPSITASMVFVSSFESKSGFAIEACAKRIARLKFGARNVPALVNPRGLEHDIDESKITGQVVVTDVDTHNGHLRGEISEFRAINEAYGAGKKRVESRVTQESIRRNLLPLSEKYRCGTIQTKPVDLAFFDGSDWNIMELKAGGDLDSSNAPSNVEKLLTIYVGMGVANCRAYFATLYNKGGEGRAWTGSVKKHLAYPEMFIIGGDFWDKILPDGISFGQFVDIYRRALEEIRLNERIVRMIDRCVRE